MSWKLSFLLQLILSSSGPLLCGQSGTSTATLPNAPETVDAFHQNSLRDGNIQSSGPSAGTENALRLTLGDAIAMAERNSPRLHDAAGSQRFADGVAQTAQAYTNPNIEVFEGQQYARPVATPGVPGLLQHYAVSQAIEIPAERRTRLRAAQRGIESSRFARNVVERLVEANTKDAFYTALKRREEIVHAEENLGLVRDLQRRVEVEVNAGEKGRLELTRTEAELARAEFMLRSAQIEYANAIALLRVTIAAPADVDLDPQGTLESRITLEPLKNLREKILQTHPVVSQSQAEIATSEALLEREKVLRIPQPVAFAEFENQPDLRFWRAGLTIAIPLFDRRKGQIVQAEAMVQRSTAALNQRKLELVSALERAYEQYELADQQVISLESGSLRAAERAVDAAKSAYRFGERGIVEVLDAQRVLQSVRGDLVDAQFARQLALVDLEGLGAVTPETRH